MLVFSGDPDRCRNVSMPDPAVRSSNTIGAPSTKPPAVMARLRASLMGANTPAVLEPPAGWPGGCCAAWPAPTMPSANAAARPVWADPKVRTTIRNAVSEIDLQPFLDLPRVAGDTDLGPQARPGAR